MGSMTPQLFTVAELCAIMCQKCVKNGGKSGGPKISKNGQKWPAKMRNKDF